jgi:hypothetical protein
VRGLRGPGPAAKEPTRDAPALIRPTQNRVPGPKTAPLPKVVDPLLQDPKKAGQGRRFQEAGPKRGYDPAKPQDPLSGYGGPPLREAEDALKALRSAPDAVGQRRAAALRKPKGKKPATGAKPSTKEPGPLANDVVSLGPAGGAVLCAGVPAPAG